MKKLLSRFKELETSKKIVFIFITALLVSELAWVIEQLIRVFVLDLTFFDGTTWGANENDYWMDFFNVNYWTQNGFNPYTDKFQSSYPPLILVFSKIFALFSDYSIGSPDVSSSFLGIFSYHLLFVLFTALTLVALIKIMRENGFSVKATIYVSVALVFSAPYLYLYGRGNYLVTVITCISWFFALYKSEKRWQRELSLVLLALAAGIKLYPAFLAVVLLKEKRFIDFIKTVIYTIIAFFVPFFAFPGGLSNVSVFLNNLLNFQSIGLVSDRNYSMPTFVYYFLQLVNGFKLSTVPEWVITVGKALSYIILGSGLILSLFTKTQWKTFALVTLAVILFPAPSYVYSATMMLPVIVLFLVDKEKTKKDYVFLALFIVMTFAVQLGYLVPPSIFEYGLSINNCLQHFALVITFVILAYESAINAYKFIKDKISQIKNKEEVNS